MFLGCKFKTKEVANSLGTYNASIMLALKNIIGGKNKLLDLSLRSGHSYKMT